MINEHALPHIESDNGAITAAMEIIAVAGVISLGAWAKVYTPFTPVPFTLQTFSVLLAAFAVSPMRATAGALLYTALGLVGAPAFRRRHLRTYVRIHPGLLTSTLRR